MVADEAGVVSAEVSVVTADVVSAGAVVSSLMSVSGASLVSEAASPLSLAGAASVSPSDTASELSALGVSASLISEPSVSSGTVSSSPICSSSGVPSSADEVSAAGMVVCTAAAVSGTAAGVFPPEQKQTGIHFFQAKHLFPVQNGTPSEKLYRMSVKNENHASYKRSTAINIHIITYNFSFVIIFLKNS